MMTAALMTALLWRVPTLWQLVTIPLCSLDRCADTHTKLMLCSTTSITATTAVARHRRRRERQNIYERSARVVALLLRSTADVMRRLRMMREQDVDGWCAMHYAARTGLLSFIDWGLLGRAIHRVPVNLQTFNGMRRLLPPTIAAVRP